MHADDSAPRLPDPDRVSDGETRADERNSMDVVIYDGQCAFCKRAARLLHRFDVGGKRLAFLSLHDQRVAERYPDLTHDRLMDEMVVVDRQGRFHGGADAVRYLTRRLPALWIAAPVMHIPGTAGLWRWCYRQVAIRRYQIAGKLGDDECENGSCAIHFQPKTQNESTPERTVPTGRLASPTKPTITQDS